jgi:hypothetical protein
MACSSAPSSPSKKRTTDEIERERREGECAAEIWLDMIHHCYKADNDKGVNPAENEIDGQGLEDKTCTDLPSTTDGDSAMSEDNPESWTTEEFDKMWAELDEKFSRWTGEPAPTQEEKGFGEQLAEAGDWNMDMGMPEQENEMAAHGTNLVSSCPSSSREEQPCGESVPQVSHVPSLALQTAAAVQGVRRRHVDKLSWDTELSSQSRALALTAPLINDRGMTGSNYSAPETNPRDFFTVGNAEWDLMAGTSWQQSSPDLTHSNPAHTGPGIGFTQGRPVFAYDRTLPLPPGLALPHMPSRYPQLPPFNPAIAAGIVQPRVSNIADPRSSRASPPDSVKPLRKEKRGAPRRRMFTTMPKTDQPLSSRALIDDEEVLKSFPEHLCLPEVMYRFVRPVGASRRIWPTERMVDFLMRHQNAKDHPDITRGERRANVKRWVVKERDACNNKARKEREIWERSTKQAISTPAQQNGPALTGQPIPLSVLLQGQPEPQEADFTPPHAHHDAHLRMPFTRDLCHDPRLAGFALPGHGNNMTFPQTAQGGPLYGGVVQGEARSNGYQRQLGFPTPAPTEEGYSSEDAEGDWE